MKHIYLLKILIFEPAAEVAVTLLQQNTSHGSESIYS